MTLHIFIKNASKDVVLTILISAMKASTDSKLDDGIILTCHLEIKFLLIKGGLVYGPLNLQDTSTPNKIVAQAYKFLEQNLVTGFNGEFGVKLYIRNLY